MRHRKDWPETKKKKQHTTVAADMASQTSLAADVPSLTSEHLSTLVDAAKNIGLPAAAASSSRPRISCRAEAR
jgi:hypothetical protein